MKILRTMAKRSSMVFEVMAACVKKVLINAIGAPRVVEANVPVPGPVRPIRTRYGRAIAAARREIIQTTSG